MGGSADPSNPMAAMMPMIMMSNMMGDKGGNDGLGKFIPMIMMSQMFKQQPSSGKTLQSETASAPKKRGAGSKSTTVNKEEKTQKEEIV